MSTSHIHKVGDKVIYTNDQGVCFGERTILELSNRPTGGPCYFISDSDSPWAPVDERCLVAVKEKPKQSTVRLAPVVKVTSERKRYAEAVTRYVAAYKPKNSDNLHMFKACKGRFTHETAKECQDWIDNFISNMSDAYKSEYPDFLSLVVVKCPCYPNHFDPMIVIFDQKDVVVK